MQKTTSFAGAQREHNFNRNYQSLIFRTQIPETKNCFHTPAIFLNDFPITLHSSPWDRWNEIRLVLHVEEVLWIIMFREFILSAWLYSRQMTYLLNVWYWTAYRQTYTAKYWLRFFVDSTTLNTPLTLYMWMFIW